MSRWRPRWRAGPASPCPTPHGSSASTWWRTSCSVPFFPTRCPKSRDSCSMPSTGREWPAPTPGATGTTSSSSATTCVFFSVGDVMGKGAPAAALMGQVRSAIRAYAVSGLSPTEVLSSLDRLFDTLIEDRVVTAVVGTITPSTGRVVLSNAGHPPPLVVRADGSATFCPMQRTLLIAAGLSGAPRPRDEVVLDRGDSLIMYSDGLIERRGEVITHGMERLANTATVVARAGWPDHPGGHLRLDVERRGAHRRHRRALPELHGHLRGTHIRPRLWVRHGMACQLCISNRWWKARRWPDTGSPRISATCPPR